MCITFLEIRDIFFHCSLQAQTKIAYMTKKSYKSLKNNHHQGMVTEYLMGTSGPSAPAQAEV